LRWISSGAQSLRSGVIEPSNGKLRDESPNADSSLSIEDVRCKIEASRSGCNVWRAHRALGFRPPNEFTQRSWRRQNDRTLPAIAIVNPGHQYEARILPRALQGDLGAGQTYTTRRWRRCFEEVIGRTPEPRGDGSKN